MYSVSIDGSPRRLSGPVTCQKIAVPMDPPYVDVMVCDGYGRLPYTPEHLSCLNTSVAYPTFPIAVNDNLCVPSHVDRRLPVADAFSKSSKTYI